MKHFEFQHNSSDQITLFGQGWEPEIGTRAVICLVHGLGEHSGRYAHVGEYFSTAGMALITFDLRGHGKSGGQRGHSPSFEAFMQDIDGLIAEAEKRYPDLPKILYGHSLGAILALAYVIKRKPNFVGTVATGAALRSAVAEQKLKISIAKVLGALLPTMNMPSGLNQLDLSRDPAVIQAYKDDPLVHNHASLAMAKFTLEGIEWVFKHGKDFPVPLLMVHGSIDKLAYPSSSRDFAALVGDQCTLKIWEGLVHEVHNEPEKADVLKYILEWTEGRL